MKNKKCVDGAETPQQKKSKGLVATCGGHLSDGTRFEEGDVLSGVTAEDLEALKELNAVSGEGE